MMKRRSFLLGLGGLLAAPAVVRAEILMPVKKSMWWGDGLPRWPGITDIQGIVMNGDGTIWVSNDTYIHHYSSAGALLAAYNAPVVDDQPFYTRAHAADERYHGGLNL